MLCEFKYPRVPLLLCCGPGAVTAPSSLAFWVYLYKGLSNVKQLPSLVRDAACVRQRCMHELAFITSPVNGSTNKSCGSWALNVIDWPEISRVAMVQLDFQPQVQVADV